MRGLMALPSTVTFVTFDVYGTLIDWETGVADAFEALGNPEEHCKILVIP